jgi:hypothetical protein
MRFFIPLPFINVVSRGCRYLIPSRPENGNYFRPASGSMTMNDPGDSPGRLFPGMNLTRILLVFPFLHRNLHSSFSIFPGFPGLVRRVNRLMSFFDRKSDKGLPRISRALYPSAAAAAELTKIVTDPSSRLHKPFSADSASFLKTDSLSLSDFSILKCSIMSDV